MNVQMFQSMDDDLNPIDETVPKPLTVLPTLGSLLGGLNSISKRGLSRCPTIAK